MHAPRRSTLLAAMLCAVLLAGCSESPPAAVEADLTRPDEAVAPAPAPVAAGDAAALVERADAASAAGRLFEPAGDNALELYLAALDAPEEASAENGQRRRLTDSMAAIGPRALAEDALHDIAPYAMSWIEQAVRKGDLDGARRVLGLVSRAAPESTALPRLRAALAEAEAAAAAPPPVATAPTPAPVSDRVAATPTATPPPASVASAARLPPPAADVVQPPPASELPAAAMAPVQSSPAAPAAAAADPAESLVVVGHVSPRYPPRALRMKLEGWVLLGFVVRADGSIDEARVISAEPEGVFDREAIAALRRWRFAPPGRDVPAERRIDFRVN